MQLITPSQLRKIYALSKERGLDNETLHAHIFTQTKKESVKELSISEAVKVIDSLQGKKTTTSGMMTKKQKNYIYALLLEINWTDDKGRPSQTRLMEFIKKQYNIEHERFITSTIASNIIEALKNIKNRNKKELTV